MREPLYAIKASWSLANAPFQGYAEINEKISFVSKQANATLFKSKALAYGWMFKAKAQFRKYKFSVITL